MQCPAKCRARCSIRSRAAEYNDVQGRHAAIRCAKTLARQALDEISFHGSRNVLLGDCQSQPVLRPFAGAREQKDFFLSRLPLCRAKNAPVVGGGKQPLRSLETLVHGILPRTLSALDANGSGCEALAPLGAAACNHGAATLGCHAGSETVGALALEYSGLKCSLHD